MPGLLPAQIRADALHFFQHITVAHRGALQLQSRFLQRALQAQVRHRGPDNHVALQRTGRFHVPARDQQHSIAIDQPPRSAGENRAIRISIKRDSHRRATFGHALLHRFGVQRTAPGVDVPPVGDVANRDDFRPQSSKQSRSQRARRAVGAIHHDFHASQVRGGQNGRAQSIEVIVVDLFVVAQPHGASLFGRFIRGKYKTFDFRFDRVGKLCAGRGNQLHAVVVIRIVRRRNHHARVETFAAHQPSDSWRSDYAGRKRCDSGRRQPTRDPLRNMRTRFPRIAPN